MRLVGCRSPTAPVRARSTCSTGSTSSSGHIHLGGQQTDILDEAGRARLRAERIGIVLQSDNLVPFLTAVENVELAMGFAPGRRSAHRARELLSELGMPSYVQVGDLGLDLLSVHRIDPGQ